MKPKITLPAIFILIASLAILGLNGPAQAETRITYNAYEDSFPDVGGDYVVWQGLANAGNWEIFMYNMATGEGPVRITNNSYGDVMPKTDGNHVVWLGHSADGSEIFLYNIATGQTTQITQDLRRDSYPEIANNSVAWSSHTIGNFVGTGDIFLYDIVNNTTTCPSLLVDPGSTMDDADPRFDGDLLVWSQEDVTTGDSSLFIYEPITGFCYQAPEGYVCEESPQKCGMVSVLSQHDGMDREIFARDDTCPWPDACMKILDRISNDSDEDWYPRIRNNYIVWQCGEGNGAEIFYAVYEPASVLTANVVVSPEILDLESNDTWVTAYVEIPSVNLSRIDLYTVRLRIGETAIPASKPDAAIGDQDMDGVPDLMVLFPRKMVHAIVSEDANAVEFLVTGNSLVMDDGQERFYFQGSSNVQVGPPDSDGDGVPDDQDNCPAAENQDQSDSDADTLGDACDTCPNDADNDADEDTVCGDVDNCPNTPNLDQTDTDGDGLGDGCDACPNDPENDIDNDGVCGDTDNCPAVANPLQENVDADTLGDACDTCPNDADNDADGDTVCGDVDNCPNTPNLDQTDTDGDGIGDACDECDNRPGTGSVTPSINILWPPTHEMVPVTIDASGIVMNNPDAQISITSVAVSEEIGKQSSRSNNAMNVNSSNSFESDYEITGPLTVNLRSERTQTYLDRTYTITVTATDCSGSYYFTTEVIVLHDQGS